ncbi:Por secretion system C-terminal sorting domain-containing protein [Hymenobacter daecheongensis DSM 21074]|uniref:Por secretion system C-terminal sorting domain-containing protein n=1 Tax=Hymenobacter daecheongensis DSM 21074 TaxID=1121955 RepID=A0A1M6AZS9_9BACT|nr:T9SS type A sorting domain-containing protein [Hymenobacter daecheongensis]SHI41941.1 Por secretion system C-terminal sorting domain-containing protein [Hymenobacter daecheongensis DSM 21074]
MLSSKLQRITFEADLLLDMQSGLRICALLFVTAVAQAQQPQLPVRQFNPFGLGENPAPSSFHRTAAATSLPHQATAYYRNYATTGLPLKQAFTEYYTYDAQGRRTEEVVTDSATATPLYRNRYVYNSQGQETSYSNDLWGNNVWATYIKREQDYDSHGNVFEARSYRSSGIPAALQLNRTTYYRRTYSASGVLTSTLTEGLDNYPGATLQPEERVTYTLTNDQWASSVYDVFITNAGWVLGAARVSQYTWHNWPTRQVASYDWEVYQGPQRRNTVTYYPNNAGQRDYGEARTTATASWQPEQRYTVRYDVEGNLVLDLHEIWKAGSGRWEANQNWAYDDSLTLSYDAQRRVVQRISQSIAPDGSLSVRSRHVYRDFRSVALANASQAPAGMTLRVYPNPAKATALLELTGSARAETLHGSLLNSVGQEVQQFVVGPQSNRAIELDLTTLPSGLYLVKIQTTGGLMQQQLLHE